MLLATLAIAFNLFSSVLVTSKRQHQHARVETVIKNVKDHKISDQTRFEDIDFTEAEEDRDDESNVVYRASFERINLFDAKDIVCEQHLRSKSSPFLKPLRSKELPLFILLENIRV